MLLFRMARRAFGRLVAFGGSTLLLFLPTLFVWSISLLKESFYFVLTVTVLAAVVEIARPSSWRHRLFCAVAIAAALVALRDLREGAVALAAVGVATGFVMAYLVARPARFAIAGAAVVIAIAAVAIVPSWRSRAVALVAQAATANAGHVYTVGHSYNCSRGLLHHARRKPRFDIDVPAAGRYVVRAATSYLLVPLPWQMTTRGELVYLPEQLLWYGLLLLAPIGVVAATRRDPVVASLLVAYVLPTAAVVALTTGNVGTLIRHRTLIVPFAVWVGAIGGAALLQWLLRREEVAR